MTKMVGVGEIERDVGGDPVAGESCLARLVRTRGVKTKLDPVHFILLGLLARGRECGTEHSGYGNRASV